MRGIRYLFLYLSLMILFIGCQKRDMTSLREVHWDRDMCQRCKMVVSDRNHTLQLINTQNGKSYMFDDIGCMVLWLKDENIEWFSTAKVWITDASTGRWIDGKKALYEDGYITPMAYGFSANQNPQMLKNRDQNLSLDDIFQLIIKIEEEKNRRSY